MELETTNKLPVEIKGTWDSAREWHGAAGQFERCKLYCQVMLGFELLALKKELRVAAGGDRKSEEAGSNSQNGNLIWTQNLEKELGLSVSSAYRFMDMAKAASARLKKLPLLRGFDPKLIAIGDLSELQKDALQTGVRKLTDDLTQKEFGEQLGLWKIPLGQNSGNHNAAGKVKLSLERQLEKAKAEADHGLRLICATLVNIGANWAALPDSDLESFDHYLDTWLKAKREWVNTPQDRRDVNTLTARLKKGYA